MIASPFDRTLFLDVDTYAAGDLSELFTLLDAFDVAAAQAPISVSFPLDGVPDAFPELNTGVIAFRRADNVTRFLQAWLAEYDRWRRTRRISPPSVGGLLDEGVRLAVLPPEFNLRFWMAGYHNQPVRILHGWGTRPTYRAVAALLNGRVEELAVSRRSSSVGPCSTIARESSVASRSGRSGSDRRPADERGAEQQPLLHRRLHLGQLVGDLLAGRAVAEQVVCARSGRARSGRGSRRRSRRGRGSTSTTFGPRSRFCCRVPTVTAGVPRNAPSRSAAEELPTMHAQCAISRTKTSGGRLRKKWKPCVVARARGTCRMPFATSLRARVDVRPEDERLHAERRDGLERLR